MSEEVGMQEMMDKYMISSSDTETTGWKRHVILSTDTNSYMGRLYWDSDDGYDMYWDDDSQVPPEASRPEFEYILDCITMEF
jgi:hypothetical protein